MAEVDRLQLRLRRAGVGEAQIRNLDALLRAAFGSPVRWELVASNPVAVVLAVAHEVHPPPPLAFRRAAVAGARRAELAALRWDAISWWWTPARKLAGIDSQWRLHDLRHWSATHAIAGGHDLRSVAARLGHADPTTTMRTYAHAVAARDVAIAETLASELDG